MSVNRVIVASALIAAAGLAGCQSTRNALGMSKVTPDEFRVVTKAPLVLPPDFSLRPPAPGKPRPQELQPESAARIALLGQREGEARSDGEKMLVAKAGADKTAAPAATPTGSDSTPIDAAAEEKRIAQLTGGKTVVIQREGQHRIKLPGL